MTVTDELAALRPVVAAAASRLAAYEAFMGKHGTMAEWHAQRGECELADIRLAEVVRAWREAKRGT